MTTEAIDYAKEQAASQLASIITMAAAYTSATTDEDREAAETAITEDALEVTVRNGWRSLGYSDQENKPEEFAILLCTGGPAVRMIGRLSEYGEPELARIEYQDWGTPWTNYPMNYDEEQACLTYASRFYFGE